VKTRQPERGRFPFFRSVPKAYSGVLQSFIPYLALIEKMGIYRAPVAGFSPGSVASRSYRNLWDKVQKNVLSQSKRQ